MTHAPTDSTAAAIAPMLRSWTPPLAWGAALIVTAVGAAAIVADDATPLARSTGALLVTLGVAGLGWGAASLARGRTVAPRGALAGIITAIVSLALALATTGGRASLIGVTAAAALLLVTAMLVGAQRRHPAPPADSVRMIPLLLAAALVAVVVTPALGAVQDAALLRDDGTIVVVDPHHGH